MNHLRIQSYAEFWPYYLSQHSKVWTQRLHALGTLLGLSFMLFGIFTLTWLPILCAPLVGYGFAWASHFWIEHNRPATWQYPLWSFVSDFRMLVLLICGKGASFSG